MVGKWNWNFIRDKHTHSLDKNHSIVRKMGRNKLKQSYIRMNDTRWIILLEYFSYLRNLIEPTGVLLLKMWKNPLRGSSYLLSIYLYSECLILLNYLSPHPLQNQSSPTYFTWLWYYSLPHLCFNYGTSLTLSSSEI
jgi:hypothetical protein